jgi:hypothetical protein
VLVKRHSARKSTSLMAAPPVPMRVPASELLTRNLRDSLVGCGLDIFVCAGLVNNIRPVEESMGQAGTQDTGTG